MRVFVFVLIILIVVAYVAMSAVLISMRIDSHKHWKEGENED